MNENYFPDPALFPAPRWTSAGCACCGGAAIPGRRLFGGAVLAAGVSAALPALAREREGVEVDGISQFARLVPPEQIEQAAAQQYAQMLQQADSQRALGPAGHPQVQRLRYIAERLIPYTDEWNARAREWKWQINLIGSQQLNAFCMPGGKIAFYLGILDKLKLTDDEVATIMGHEMAHALREHARERLGKTVATRGAIELGSALFGLGTGGRYLADMGAQLLTLRFSRDDESEADLVGMEIAARGGYDPAAGVSLWQKMGAAGKGAPPQWLSTHPAGPTRIRDIQEALPKVQPLYARAQRPERRFGPPASRQGAGSG